MTDAQRADVLESKKRKATNYIQDYTDEQHVFRKEEEPTSKAF